MHELRNIDTSFLCFALLTLLTIGLVCCAVSIFRHRKKRNRLDWWLRPATYVLTGAIVILFDPFGIGTATDEYSHDSVIRAVLGPFQSDQDRQISESEDSTIGIQNPDVSVILLREFDLLQLDANEELRASVQRQRCAEDYEKTTQATELQLCLENIKVQRYDWPLKMAQHVDFILQVLSYEPQAIFVDVLFIEERDPSPDEIALLLELSRNWSTDTDIKIYFVGSPRPNEFENRADLQTNVDKFAHARFVFPPKVPERGILRTYPHRFALCDNPPCNPDDKEEWSAAFDIFFDQHGISEANRASFEKDLDIIWGTTPGAFSDDWFDCKEGEEIYNMPIQRWTYRLRHAILDHGILRKDRLMRRCPYIGTIPFVSFYLQDERHDVEFQKRHLIKDKVVFYGVSLTGADDVIYTPVHERLPGVYMHAAAYDNLLRYGDRFLSRPKAVDGIGEYTVRRILDCFILAVIVLTWSAFWVRDQRLDYILDRSFRRKGPGKRRSKQLPRRQSKTSRSRRYIAPRRKRFLIAVTLRRLRIWAFGFGASIAVMVCTAVVLVRCFSLSPYNWAWMILLGAGFNLYWLIVLVFRSFFVTANSQNRTSPTKAVTP
ncbi:MAG: CHASE2 domain-containing protein [Pseudomonadota bacterium]